MACHTTISESLYQATPRELASKSPIELAAWHAAQPPGSVQFILAQREWRRRLRNKQQPADRLSATVTAIAALLGLVAGYMLSTSNAIPDVRSLQIHSGAAEYRALLKSAAPPGALELKLDRGIYEPEGDQPLRSLPAVLM